MTEQKPTPLGARVWFSAVFFGLIGQIAWIVENMYFATFAQDIFANSQRADLSYGVTTLMVILSAIAATVTTIFAGGLIGTIVEAKELTFKIEIAGDVVIEVARSAVQGLAVEDKPADATGEPAKK